jgi:hypothetical protein
MHNGEKYSFEVGPSIFEGLDRPSLNPLRMIFDVLEEEMPVKTYTGLGYWTPTGYWRFPIGSQSKFEDLLMEQAEDGPKAVEVCFFLFHVSCCRYRRLNKQSLTLQALFLPRNGTCYANGSRHLVVLQLQFRC